MDDLDVDPDFQTSKGLLFELEQVLATFPGYEDFGRYKLVSKNYYGHIIMKAISLCDAAREVNPEALGC